MKYYFISVKIGVITWTKFGTYNHEWHAKALLIILFFTPMMLYQPY